MIINAQMFKKNKYVRKRACGLFYDLAKPTESENVRIPQF